MRGFVSRAWSFVLVVTFLSWLLGFSLCTYVQNLGYLPLSARIYVFSTGNNWTHRCSTKNRTLTITSEVETVVITNQSVGICRQFSPHLHCGCHSSSGTCWNMFNWGTHRPSTMYHLTLYTENRNRRKKPHEGTKKKKAKEELFCIRAYDDKQTVEYQNTPNEMYKNTPSLR